MELKRIHAKDCLSKYLTNKKNIELIEELIYTYTNSVIKKYEYKEEYIYNTILYQCIYYISQGMSVVELGKQFVSFRLLFKLDVFQKYIENQLEHDNYIENPVNITEGVFQCNSCKSKHIITFQKQTRSADEGYTIFNTCVKCNNKWKIN